MADFNYITRKSYLSKAVAFAFFMSPFVAFADAIDDFQSHFASQLSQIASGNMAVEDLGKNLVLDVAVAVKRGASGKEIGSILVASAPNNNADINFQLSALLGAVGAMVEAGAIKGENAFAKDFYHSSCEFAKSARLSQTIINIECSR